MRKLLLFLLLMPLIVKSQIPGSKISGPISVLGKEYKVGDTLKVGTGTNPSGDFKFIYMPQNALVGTPQQSLSKSFSNTEISIKHFKEYSGRKFGKKIFTVVNFGGLNMVIELESAIESGEIVIKGYSVKGSQSTVNQLSVADELAKFKKLLDDGLITKDEYELQKKKLLGM